MNLIAEATKSHLKKNPPVLRPGNTVRVHQRIIEGAKERIQIFEGLVISVRAGRGLNGNYTVRRVGAGTIGVERTFPLHAPYILKVERVKTAQVRRAKLNYMRTRFGKAARFSKEKRESTVWEEPEAEKELEKIKEEKAEAAEEKAELEHEKVAELEEKFEKARVHGEDSVPSEANHQSPITSHQSEETDEKRPDDATGDAGGESGEPVSEAKGPQDSSAKPQA